MKKEKLGEVEDILRVMSIEQLKMFSGMRLDKHIWTNFQQYVSDKKQMKLDQIYRLRRPRTNDDLVKNAVEHESKTKLLSEVKHYGRQIWLAGLGVYFKAGQEGVGYLKELVKTGEGVEKKGKALVAEQVEAASEELDSVKSNLSTVKGKVELQIDKIEQAFEEKRYDDAERFVHEADRKRNERDRLRDQHRRATTGKLPASTSHWHSR